MRLSEKAQLEKQQLSNIPEMVCITKERFRDLMRNKMVCQFLSDLNQGTNGDLHMPADWLYEAQGVIGEAVDKVIAALDEHAIRADPEGKIKIYGIEVHNND